MINEIIAHIIGSCISGEINVPSARSYYVNLNVTVIEEVSSDRNSRRMREYALLASLPEYSTSLNNVSIVELNVMALDTNECTNVKYKAK